MSDSARAARARLRKQRAVLRKSALTSVERDLSPVRGEEALSLVHRLTLQSWSMAGRQPPPRDNRRHIAFVPWSIRNRG